MHKVIPDCLKFFREDSLANPSIHARRSGLKMIMTATNPFVALTVSGVDASLRRLLAAACLLVRWRPGETELNRLRDRLPHDRAWAPESGS